MSSRFKALKTEQTSHIYIYVFKKTNKQTKTLTCVTTSDLFRYF